MLTREAVLTVNTGSSSIKLSAYQVEAGRLGRRLLKASLSGLPDSRHFSAETESGVVEKLPEFLASARQGRGELVAALASWIAEYLVDVEIRAVGHRVVHGGQDFAAPVLADAGVIERLQKLSVLAPSHQPDNLAGVEGISRLWPEIPQTLSFDTAYHRTQPRIAQLYAIPRKLSDEGLLRFGFHGLSYAHIADALSDVLPPERRINVIAAHLGSGASLCAIRDGKSVATSMGLTALDGIPMATRSGSVDPGLILHLIKDRGMCADDVSTLLYGQSGLLGLSCISGDVRKLLESDDAAAAEALDVFVYRIVREIGSLAAALQGLDVLVFTGGVGENSWQIRQRVSEQLCWLGACLDPDANKAGQMFIQSAASRIIISVLSADEEAVIARETLTVLNGY